MNIREQKYKLLQASHTSLNGLVY